MQNDPSKIILKHNIVLCISLNMKHINMMVTTIVLNILISSPDHTMRRTVTWRRLPAQRKLKQENGKERSHDNSNTRVGERKVGVTIVQCTQLFENLGVTFCIIYSYIHTIPF